jgi:hypothetical protein
LEALAIAVASPRPMTRKPWSKAARAASVARPRPQSVCAKP